MIFNYLDLNSIFNYQYFQNQTQISVLLKTKYLIYICNMKIRHQIKPVVLKNTDKKSEFFGEVIFGIPSKDCKNYGICRINKLSKISAKSKKNVCGCQSAIAQFTYWDSHNLQMKFIISSIAQITKQKYFVEPYFKIEEDYPLIISSENKHTKSIQYIIKKGVYLILKSSSHYTLNL